MKWKTDTQEDVSNEEKTNEEERPRLPDDGNAFNVTIRPMEIRTWQCSFSRR
jgi:hypothetical protein